MVDLVMQENPDTLEVLGRTCKIEYQVESRHGDSPILILTGDDLDSQPYAWRQLPDEGIKLPGGRFVAVQIGDSYWNASRNSKQRLKLNQKRWEEWKDRPEISRPSPEDENTEFVCRAEAVYGKCVVTDQPLLAYGTIGLESGYYSSSAFKTMWFRSCEEAGKAFEAAKAVFEGQQAEARERRLLEAARTVAQQVMDKLNGLYREHYCNSELSGDLQRRLHDRLSQYLPSTVAELRQWQAESEALIAEVEAVIAEAERKKAEQLALFRKLACPILRPGQKEDENTVYGMPCNDEGPCEAQAANSWQLYSVQEGQLVRHKGFRSSSYGNTLAELVSDYLRGDDDLEAVLRILPDWAKSRPKLDPVREAVGGDANDARVAAEFAEAAVKCCGGHKARALDILDAEFNSAYGRSRRQSAIEQNLPGIANTEVGQRFLSFSRATDVNAILSGAIAHLSGESPRTMYRYDAPAPQAAPSVLQQVFEPSQQAAEATFTELKDRNFRCDHCGATERLTKTDWRDYQTGQEISITCPGCRAEGWVKK